MQSKSSVVCDLSLTHYRILVTSKPAAATENSKFTSYKIHHPNVCEIIQKQICCTNNCSVCFEVAEHVIDFYSDGV